MSSDRFEPERLRRAVTYRARRWLLVRRHRFELRPHPAFAPTAVELRSGSTLPERTVVLRVTAAAGDPHDLRLFAHDRHGRGRLVHEIPHTEAGVAVDRLVNLPTQLTDLYVVDAEAARAFTGEVEALELGRVPLLVWLMVARSRRPTSRDRAAPVAVARRAGEILASHGPRGVLERLYQSHIARADPRPGRVRLSSDPITAKRTVDGADPQLVQRHHRSAETDLARLLASDQRVVLPRADDPEVTVVLVTWGGDALTLQGLRALATSVDVSIEVVIVDNGSTDQTLALLDRVDGATIIRNGENLGYQVACNQGASAGSGEFVLLCNTDAEVRPHAIAAAVAAARARGAWVVGGPVVALDGLLQEAGGIMWSDGSCEGFGRGLRPDRDEFQHPRPVDYISGVFLLARRDRWDELGGLDERYHPAYYEDADLCFRTWERGGSVWYEPEASVMHVEHGLVASVDRARQLMRERREIFREIHGASLAEQEPPDRSRRLHAALRDRTRLRVLVVDDRVPFADEGSGAPRMAAMVSALVELGSVVTFFAKLLPSAGHRDPHEVLPREVEALVGRGMTALGELLRERRDLYDVVLISRPANMVDLRAMLDQEPDLLGRSKLVYDAEAVEAHRLALAAQVAGEPMSASAVQALVRREVQLAEVASLVLAVSEPEAADFVAHGVEPVAVVGHAVAPAPAPGRGGRTSLLFVGNLRYTTLPNVDGLCWFLDEVLPKLVVELAARDLPIPEVRVVGSTTPTTEAMLAHEGAILLGAVADLRAEYDRAAVFIAPTRFGAGIPLKVVDAAAHGVPVAATDLITAQLRWPDGAIVATPVDGAAMAVAIADLLGDDAAWVAQRTAALEQVERSWSHEALRAAMRTVLEGCGPEPLWRRR